MIYNKKLSTRLYIYTHTYIYTYMHTCIYAYLYVYIYVYVHIYIGDTRDAGSIPGSGRSPGE